MKHLGSHHNIKNEIRQQKISFDSIMYIGVLMVKTDRSKEGHRDSTVDHIKGKPDLQKEIVKNNIQMVTVYQINFYGNKMEVKISFEEDL